MGFLDFAPEPPAPSATPVTEHIDLNCAPSNDTRDLSSKTVPVVLPSHVQPNVHVLTRTKTSWIPLGSTPNGEVRVKFETLRSMDPETLEIDGHMSQHSIHHLDLFSNKQPADAIILKTDPPAQKQPPPSMMMEIDASNIKHEQSTNF